MTPGEHSYAENSPDRSLGTLRDTILIILPGPQVMLVALHRADIENTVVETLLNHGQGALNIDACRIRGPNPSIERRKGKAPIPTLSTAEANEQGVIAYRGRPEVYNEPHPGEEIGRWPPNVLLVHGPNCRQIGSRTESRNLVDASTRSTPSLFGAMGGSVSIGSFSEEVPIYDCQHDCPVRLLDEMVGFLHARGNTSPSTGGGGLYGLPTIPVPPNPSDSGPASRFFPTFPDLLSAQQWLQILIGQS